jgi:hypothetical protein
MVKGNVVFSLIRSMWIRFNFVFARILGVWLGLAVCFLYLQDSQKRSFASDILIFMYDANRLTSSLLRWSRCWYHYYRVGAWAFLFLFLFLFLVPLLLLAAGDSGVGIVEPVGRSEASCAGDALGSSCIVNAIGGVAAFLYGVGKRIGYSLLCSAIRTMRFPICSIHFIDSQSNMGLWGRRSMNAMRLVLNVGIWRIPVSTSSLGSSTVSIVIAGSDILPPASMISGSQISYVVNQAFSWQMV